MQALTVGDSRLVLVQGDITLQDTDAIVNAANTSLLGGGGVDGANPPGGRPADLEECRSIVPGRGAAPRDRRSSRGGRLKARFVIHAVGPVWRGGGHGEDAALRSAYAASLAQALAVGAESVSFPCISTGSTDSPSSGPPASPATLWRLS